MALTPGTRLGVYEVTDLIGAGGMGEVYRATDSNLKRSVAIKMLPASVASDTDRLARFQREAEVLAVLNHPNIAAIYGLEKTPDFTALVMELVEGDDLSQRIARRAIPLDEALPIAKQIADALEAAHEQGIIHRDLKPANIKVRPDGTVKVLDFGLAKAMEPAAGSSSSMSMSPTITTPAMTQAGMILGTAAYMSPEQARGRTVDKRADIWAFGCVLFEMLTGKRAFPGEDITDTLAAVVKLDPAWDVMGLEVPARVRQVLRVCLQKNPKQRAQSMGDVRLALQGAFETVVAQPAVSATRPTPGWRRAVPWAAASVAASVVSGAAVWFLARPAPKPAPAVQRLAMPLPEKAPYVGEAGGGLAISPDGTRLVYAGIENGRRLLYMRVLDQLESRAIPGTDDAYNPFFSYDGEWIAFFTFGGTTTPVNKLKKVAVRGGPPLTICDAPLPVGGTWGKDGAIVFGTTSDATSGWKLLQVPAAGGVPKDFAAPDVKKKEALYAWPELLPGGKAFLFSIATNKNTFDESHVALFSLETGTYRTVVEQGFRAQYVPTGHIVYMLGSNLMAVPFDARRLEVTGPAVPLVENVRGRTNTGEFGFAVSSTGFLVYAPGGAGGGNQRGLVWVDRQGHEEPINVPLRAYVLPRLSPDGKRIALDIRDQESDIWTWDIARQGLTRLTFNAGADQWPVWTADGSRIVFASDKAGAFNLYSQAADGTGQPERLTESSNVQLPTSMSPDGKRLVFRETDPKTNNDLKMLTLDGERRVIDLVHTQYVETNGEVSPDGRWLAYQSNESGQDEVYVRAFPNEDGGRSQVSVGGGAKPLWARSGRELFYVTGTGAVRVMSAAIEPGTSFSARTPVAVFEGPYFASNNGRTYDVSPDGQRFLMIKDPTGIGASAAPSQFIVVSNWFEELNRLVPTK